MAKVPRTITFDTITKEGKFTHEVLLMLDAGQIFFAVRRSRNVIPSTPTACVVEIYNITPNPDDPDTGVYTGTSLEFPNEAQAMAFVVTFNTKDPGCRRWRP